MRITLASSDAVFAAVSSYTGVHQTTPLGTPATNIGVNGPTVTVTAVVGDWVLDASGTKETASPVVDPSQTQRWNGSQSAQPFGFGSTEVAATTSVVMNWTGATEEFASIGVAMKAAPAGDTTPPTPDPMTFVTAPNDASTTSISMTATTASDPSTPVEYLFTFAACASDGGTGGTSSLWQTPTSYTDTVLQVNQCYGYTVNARDSVPNTGTASSSSEAYTAANDPGTPVVSSPTTTSLTVDNAPNSNPAITTFAIAVDDDGDGSVFNVTKYVQADGTIGASAVWQTEATWGARSSPA